MVSFDRQERLAARLVKVGGLGSEVFDYPSRPLLFAFFGSQAQARREVFCFLVSGPCKIYGLC